MLDLKQQLQKILLEEFAVPQDAFIEIESELRNNARAMGINYDNSIIVNTNRTLSKPQDIGDWSHQHKQWAGYGSSWIDWVARAMPQWLASKFYVLTVDHSNIITIPNKKTKLAFEKHYIINPDTPKDKAINFDKLYKEGKDGVAFRPYNKSWGNHDWYTSIDMDSIVIINNKAIKSVKLLLDASEIIADFKDRSSDF